MSYLRPRPDGVLLAVYVQPKSSRNRLAGIHGDALKVTITAPPVDGKANEAVIGFFAKLFHLPKSSVAIQSGMQGRNKSVFLAGISQEQAALIISESLPAEK
jgi:hypothetical protein